jgi:hypothetical protein
MNPQPQHLDTARYARCIEISKRIRWDLERDVIRGRKLDFSRTFLPEGLSLAGRLAFRDDAERRFFSQVQGRTYANMFGLVERFIAAKMLEVSRSHWLGDQVALEALVRFTDEELKHQALFRRIEALAAEGMPAGYRFEPQANPVAQVVLGKSTWAVLALTCLIELFTQSHYRESIEPGAEICDLWKDVFLFHWKEESQHAILDELEWMRENAAMTAAQRDAAVGDLIDLVAAVDGILQVQARADAQYYVNAVKGDQDLPLVTRAFLAAYRWQYIGSGVRNQRFGQILGGMINAAQSERIGAALKPILET